MNKILTVFVIAATLTSCGSGGTDAAVKTDSAITSTADSAAKVADSAARIVDSTIKAAADTVNAKVGAATDSIKKASRK